MPPRHPADHEHDADTTSSWPIVPDLEDPVAELPGCIWFLRNDTLGITNRSSADHPGACVRVDSDLRAVTVSPGSDADKSWGYGVRVEPSATNGLTKGTMFRFHVRLIRFHVIRRSHASRYAGRLSDAELTALQRGAHRALDRERGHD